jgi:hypothetical protein
MSEMEGWWRKGCGKQNDEWDRWGVEERDSAKIEGYIQTTNIQTTTDDSFREASRSG